MKDFDSWLLSYQVQQSPWAFDTGTLVKNVNHDLIYYQGNDSLVYFIVHESTDWLIQKWNTITSNAEYVGWVNSRDSVNSWCLANNIPIPTNEDLKKIGL